MRRLAIALIAVLMLTILVYYSKEGMCSLSEFEEANIRGQMPKPLCANGFVLDSATDCVPYDRGCASGYHVVCPGVSVDKNGTCV